MVEGDTDIICFCIFCGKVNRILINVRTLAVDALCFKINWYEAGSAAHIESRTGLYFCHVSCDYFCFFSDGGDSFLFINYEIKFWVKFFLHTERKMMRIYKTTSYNALQKMI